MNTEIARDLFKLIEEKKLFNNCGGHAPQLIRNIMSQSDATLYKYYKYINTKNTNSVWIARSLFDDYNKNAESKIKYAMENILNSVTQQGEEAILTLMNDFDDSEILKELISAVADCENKKAPRFIYRLLSNTEYSNDTIIQIADFVANIDSGEEKGKIIQNILSYEIIDTADSYDDEKVAIEWAKILTSAKGYHQAYETREILNRFYKTDKKVEKNSRLIANYAAKAESDLGAEAINKYYSDKYKVLHEDIKYARILSKIKDEKVVKRIYEYLDSSMAVKTAYGKRFPEVLLIAANSKCVETELAVISHLYEHQQNKTKDFKFLNDSEIDVIVEVLKEFKGLDPEKEAPSAFNLLINDYRAYSIAMDNPSYIHFVYSLYGANKLNGNAKNTIRCLDKINRKDNISPIESIMFYALVKNTSKDDNQLNDYILYSNSIAKSSSKYVDFDEYYLEDAESALKGLEEINKKYPTIDVNPRTCYVRKKENVKK